MKLENRHKLMIFLSIILTYLSFYFPLANYEVLPDMIPVHFNIFGEPDKWAAKSIGSVLFAPIILGITAISMLAFTWWMTKVKDPYVIINVPKAKLEKMSLETAEEIRRITILHLLIILLLVALMFFIITVNQILVALGQTPNIGWTMLGIVVILIIDTLYLTWKLFRLIG